MSSEGVRSVHVTIDLTKCIGAGACVRAADRVFGQDDDTGLAYLLDEQVDVLRASEDETSGNVVLDGGGHTHVEEAARACPTRAIEIETTTAPSGQAGD